MASSDIKTELERVDGTPEKRMFWSIISDYDLRTGICELVDNAIDNWMAGGRKSGLEVRVNLDPRRSLISVWDNAGGVRKDDLRLLIAPGGSRNDPNAPTIGIFGVGSKRAGIALGAQVVIKTRYKREPSYQIDITDQWLENPNWDMPIYQIGDLTPATTEIEISHIRDPFSSEDVESIRARLGEIYSWFIEAGCEIRLNGTLVEPIKFDDWAFPPNYLPRFAEFEAKLGDHAVNFIIHSGLIKNRDGESENYGVYFYCNNRLIAKEVRSREVGYFVTSEAGVPHPDASLCRVLVYMNGPAEAMPWNSSKSSINYGHAAFQAVRPTLIQLVSYFSSLSRRLKGDWDHAVFRFVSGNSVSIDPEVVAESGKIDLPALPRVNKPKVEKLKSTNKRIIKDQPWTLGLIEAIAAIDVISRQKFDTGNRISLILLDSNVEIALKEYIVHRSDLFRPSIYNDKYIKDLFSNRSKVIDEIELKKKLPTQAVIRARHYYAMRNKLIHERATVGVTDADVLNYRGAVQEVLQSLFGVRFPR